MFSEVKTVGRLLILFGGVLVVLGLVFMFSDKIPLLGKLPGDIHVHRKNFSLHFPLVSSLLISIVLTILLNLLARK